MTTTRDDIIPTTRFAATPTKPWPAIWALIAGFFMIMMDATIVSVAIPTLMHTFSVGVTAVIWVTSAYLLGYAVPLLACGRLGDRFGPRNMYAIGLVVFTLSSLACGLSPNISFLIGARVVQGLGGAMMSPQTLTIITRLFPPNKRGVALASWGATAGIATLVGPILGGVLIDSFGWEWIFYVNVPIGIAAVIATLVFVPQFTSRYSRTDLMGVLLSGIGIFLIVFGIEEGSTFHWGTINSWLSIPGLIAAGVLVTGIFLWWQGRTRNEPLIPLRLFTDRNFSLANLGILATGFAITAMPFPVMLYAQSVMGYDPTHAALLLAPMALASLFAAPVVGPLVDKIQPRVLATIGIATFGICLALLGFLLRPETSLWTIAGVFVLVGIATSLTFSPLSTAATSNLRSAEAGAGSGVFNTSRQIGSVLGSAAVAAVMQWRITALVGPSTGGGMAATGRPMPHLIADPFAQALGQSLLLPAALCLLAAVATVFMRRPLHLEK